MKKRDDWFGDAAGDLALDLGFNDIKETVDAQEAESLKFLRRIKKVIRQREGKKDPDYELCESGCDELQSQFNDGNYRQDPAEYEIKGMDEGAIKC